MKHLADFFAYARERYRVYLLRLEGKPFPWTPDPILKKYRFCNVFRTDDKVTQWILQNLLKPLVPDDDAVVDWRLLPITVAARFINRIDTLSAVKDILLNDGWDSRAMKRALTTVRQQGGKVVTGAYMIRTPFGVNKIKGLDQILHPLQKWSRQEGYRHYERLQDQHQWLCTFPYIGSFMSYEVVTDLSYLFPYEDKMTWANAGPGAARGLSRVLDGKLGRFRNSPTQQAAMCEHMRHILDASFCSEDAWPAEWPIWDMRTVEHTLCEFDKYERVRLGEGRPKQVFKPAT
jgi:hypothetical protein